MVVLRDGEIKVASAVLLCRYSDENGDFALVFEEGKLQIWRLDREILICEADVSKPWLKHSSLFRNQMVEIVKMVCQLRGVKMGYQ